jgi:hypothetical protein
MMHETETIKRRGGGGFAASCSNGVVNGWDFPKMVGLLKG